MTDMGGIEAARREVAEEICGAFDFGYQVVDQCGREATMGDPAGDEWRRTLFFQDPGNPTGDSLKGSLSIAFGRGGVVPLSTTAAVHDEVVGNPMHALHQYARA